MKKRWLFFGLILFLPYFLYWGYEEVTGDFRSVNYTFHDLPYRSEWVNSILDSQKKEELIRILDQPFTYLGKGHQTFVFVSKDQKYVLKMFRFRRLQPSRVVEFFKYVPVLNKFALKYEKKQKSRLHKLFHGYHIADLYDRKNTGLIYVHMRPSETLKREVVLFDWFGISHRIDLDSVVFVVQEKGEMTRDVMQKLFKEGKIAEVKQAFRALVSMYLEEYRIGIVDKDRNVMHNTGFLGNRPFRLDIGQLTYEEEIKQNFSEDLQKIIQTRMVGWLNKYHPEHAQEIEKDLSESIKEIEYEKKI